MYDYLQLAGPIVDSPSLRRLANVAAARPGENLGTLAERLMHTVHNRFTYQKGVTTAASPITEILEHNGGVCQDFAHLLIGLARVLGIPARYVSGCIHRENESIRGHAQTHAWCELYFPSTAGSALIPPTTASSATSSSRSPTAAISATSRPTRASSAAPPAKPSPSAYMSSK